MTQLRPRSISALTLSCVVVLSACGGQDSTGSSGAAGEGGTSTAADSGASTHLPPAEGKTQYPITLKTAWGETTLEKRPERIAVVQPSGQDTELLASTGVTPVFAPSDSESWVIAAMPGKIEKTVEINKDEPFPYEAIAQAQPDVIVVTGWDLKDSYQRLASIAPVVGAGSAAEVDAPWRDRLPKIGEALDLPGAAAAAVKKRDDHLAQVRSQNPQFAKKVLSYAVYYPGDTGLGYQNAAGSDTESLFTGLGFAPAPAAKKYVDDNTVSLENVKDLDTDALLLSDNSDGQITKVTGNALFKSLGVAKNGRAVLFSPTDDGYTWNGKQFKGNLPWSMHIAGPLSDVWAADQVVPMLKTVIR